MYEKKILLHSKHLSLLTLVAESIRLLIYPLDWITVYIPISPAQLMEIVQAPMSFLLGVHTSFILDNDIPLDVHVVDIDNNIIRSGEDLPPLPFQALCKCNLAFMCILLLRKKGVLNIHHQFRSDPRETKRHS
jgi:hypothetical protein